jgi:hypothetical protein
VSQALLDKNRLYRNDLQQLLPLIAPNMAKNAPSAQNLVTQK